MASNIESVDNELVITYDNEIPLKSSKKMFCDDRTADVYFVFKSDGDSDDGSPIRIPAHKIILAAASDVFDAMFYGDLKENGDVQVVDASAAGFEEFLQFFYVTQVKVTAENVAEVMKLADKYNVPECLEICVNSLKSSLTLENVCIGLELAILYEQNELKQCCEQLIALYTENILKSTSFVNCDKRVLEHILKMDILSCSETEVFEGCVAWLKVNSGQDELTKEIVKAHLGNSFYEIRFASMSMKDFAALTSSYGSLFSFEEYKDIIQMIELPEHQPKLFNRSLRQAHWNTDAVIKCDRIETDSTLRRNMNSSETSTSSTTSSTYKLPPMIQQRRRRGRSFGTGLGRRFVPLSPGRRQQQQIFRPPIPNFVHPHESKPFDCDNYHTEVSRERVFSYIDDQIARNTIYSQEAKCVMRVINHYRMVDTAPVRNSLRGIIEQRLKLVQNGNAAGARQEVQDANRPGLVRKSYRTAEFD